MHRFWFEDVKHLLIKKDRKCGAAYMTLYSFFIWARRNKISEIIKIASKSTPIMMSTSRKPQLFASFIRVFDRDRAWEQTWYSNDIHMEKYTHLDTQMHSSHPLCPASGSCSMKSGFFLLSLETFSNQCKASSGSWPTSRTTQASQLSYSI